MQRRIVFCLFVNFILRERSDFAAEVGVINVRHRYVVSLSTHEYFFSAKVFLPKQHWSQMKFIKGISKPNSMKSFPRKTIQCSHNEINHLFYFLTESINHEASLSIKWLSALFYNIHVLLSLVTRRHMDQGLTRGGKTFNYFYIKRLFQTFFPSIEYTRLVDLQ